MRYIIILVIIAVGVFDAASHTVESQLYVDNLSLEDGLSNNFVTAISQDKHGFLWVGTESGLNRFDGDNFVLYHENNSSLAGNSINALFYDADTDKLWIGSKKGLNVLDCSTQELREFDADAVPRMKLSRIDEEFIKKFTRIVEENIADAELDMTYMQQTLNMSHSTLYRKIKGLTGISGNEFIRRIRLKRGKELLMEGCNVSEAAYSCGFNDVGYFRNCFKDEYGMSPSQFIKEKVKQNQV